MKGQLKEAEDSGDQGGGVEEAEHDDSTTMTADDPEEDATASHEKEKARLNSKKKKASKNRWNRNYYAKHKEELKRNYKRRFTREERPLDCFCDQKFADTPDGRKLRGACLKQHLEEAKKKNQFSDQQTIMSYNSWLEQKKSSLREIRDKGGYLTVRQCGQRQCLSCDDLVTEEGNNTPG